MGRVRLARGLLLLLLGLRFGLGVRLLPVVFTVLRPVLVPLPVRPLLGSSTLLFGGRVLLAGHLVEPVRQIVPCPRPFVHGRLLLGPLHCLRSECLHLFRKLWGR
eukprot:179058_1